MGETQEIFFMEISNMYILGWPKSSFGVFHNILQKNPNRHFGQPNTSSVLQEVNIVNNSFFFPPPSLWGRGEILEICLQIIVCIDGKK